MILYHPTLYTEVADTLNSQSVVSFEEWPCNTGEVLYLPCLSLSTSAIERYVLRSNTILRVHMHNLAVVQYGRVTSEDSFDAAGGATTA